MSSGFDNVHDEHGRLTHKMCPICFAMTPIADLWRDEDDQKWDLCSEECAVQAFGSNPGHAAVEATMPDVEP